MLDRREEADELAAALSKQIVPPEHDALVQRPSRLLLSV